MSAECMKGAIGSEYETKQNVTLEMPSVDCGNSKESKKNDRRY